MGPYNILMYTHIHIFSIYWLWAKQKRSQKPGFYGWQLLLYQVIKSCQNSSSSVLHCMVETEAKSKNIFLQRYIHKPHSSTSQSQMNLSVQYHCKAAKSIYLIFTDRPEAQKLKLRFRQSEFQLNLKVLCFQSARCL